MMSKEALKLALEALENNKQTHYYCEDTWYSCPQHEDGCANDFAGDECNCGADKANAEIEKAITALKEALAQPEEGPVGWLDSNDKLAEFMHKDLKAEHDKRDSSTPRDFQIPVYTTPPTLSLAQRTWVGLTDEEMFEAIRQLYSSDKVARLAVSHSKDEYRAIEAKLKEKNT